MFVKIIKEDFTFPQDIKISDECKDLIQQLQIKNPEKRLGNQTDAFDIKNHPWFKDIDFDDILNKKVNFEYLKKIDKITLHTNYRK